MKYEQIIVVRAKTRLEQLIERFNTIEQARFYLERVGENFNLIKKEHERFYNALDSLNKLLYQIEKYKVIDKSFLPNYIFTSNDLIIGIGQDGLIANIAKYAKGQPILGFNPNPEVYDGILLPYSNLTKKGILRFANGDFDEKKVTMAKASFSDGQELLAFNDFFIGQKTHTSSRYTIKFNQKKEHQSSSGIIVSTGIGSTGWMSSISNMVNGIGKNSTQMTFAPESRYLKFAVREPFISKTTSANICNGSIELNNPLTIDSNMLQNGVVFSDGIEKDNIEFNIGSKVSISVARETANLIR